MNNGQTRESKHRIAVLEDEEVEVFTAFCEYAYTRDYTVPPYPGRVEEPPYPQLVRSQSRESFVPPPAPSPPPAAQAEQERPGTSGSARAAPEPEQPAPEVPEGDKQPEAKDDGAAEAAPETPKKSGKKDKKKKKKGALAVDDAPANLTPPSTPPMEKKEPAEEPGPDIQAKPEQQPTAAEDPSRDVAVETDPGDSPDGNNWWDQPASPTQRARSPPAENTNGEDAQDPTRQTGSAIDTSFASQRINRRSYGGSSWEDFVALEYEHPDPVPLPMTPVSNTAAVPEVPYLLFHAKVYVFATRYLISGLAQLCLKKLHAELLNFSLTPPSEDEADETAFALFNARAQMFLDVMRYTYNKTTRFEPECQTSATLLRESELRKLVTHFAACKMRELAAYIPLPMPVPASPHRSPGLGVPAVLDAPSGSLRDLLDSTPELASDLVFRLI